MKSIEILCKLADSFNSKYGSFEERPEWSEYTKYINGLKEGFSTAKQRAVDACWNAATELATLKAYDLDLENELFHSKVKFMDENMHRIIKVLADLEF